MSVRAILSAISIKETGWMLETRPSSASSDIFSMYNPLSQVLLSSEELVTYTPAHNTGYYVLTKFNTDGGIVFAKAIAYQEYRMFSGSVAADTSNNIYTLSVIENPVVSGLRDVSLRKYNSSGTLLWEKVINVTSNDGVLGGLKIIANYVYFILAGTLYSLVKLDLDGNLQFIKNISIQSGTGAPRAFHINSSNILVVGFSIWNASFSADNIGWVTFNLNNNSVLYNKRLTSSASMALNQIHIDDSSNIYICSKVGVGTISKYDLYGALLWRKGILSSGTAGSCYDLKITSSHLYATGYAPNTSAASNGGYGWKISKYTLAGVFVSHVIFSFNSDYIANPVVDVTESGLFYSSASSNNYQCTVKGNMGNTLFTSGNSSPSLPWAFGFNKSTTEGTVTAQAPTETSTASNLHTITAGTSPTITTGTNLSIVDMTIQRWVKTIY
jgi:hypothetical protein